MNGKRVAAGFIDLLIAGVIQFFLMLIFIIVPVLRGYPLNSIFLTAILVTFSSMAYMFLRELFGGRSLGKRLLKLKVIDSKTGRHAPPVKCLLRNLTWILGPLEVLIYLVKGARLGDMLAGTDVVEI